MRALQLVMATVAALVPGVPSVGASAAAGTTMRATTAVRAAADPRIILGHIAALTGADRSARGVPTVHATAAGGDSAAEYIATQFMSYGLKPAGDNGTYFQDVPLTEVRTLPDTSLVAVATDLRTLTLRNLEDVVTHNEAQTPSTYVDAPIVFVGYGIQAPEYDWDDYKDVDLHGKVALLLANEPADAGRSRFPAHAPTRYGSAGYKFAEAARRGAVAALIVHAAVGAGDTWEAVREDWGTRFYRRGEGGPRLQAASWIEGGGARRLAALAGLDIEALALKAQAKDFTPVELPLRLQAHVASAVRAVTAHNVLAALPGRGGSSREAVLYTARYDRLGSGAAPTGTGSDGDRVRNAAGVATLLETARLWSRRSAAPPRMMLFAALAAESHGLPAADSLVDPNGAVPPGRISVVLNYEQPVPGGDAGEVVVRGGARISFSPTVAATAKALGIALHSDPFPAPGRDYDSSAYRLALAGVPSLTLAERSARNTVGGTLVAAQLAGNATLARFGYELGVEAASQRELIRWQTGDEFEAVRKSSQLPDQAGNRPLQRKPKRVR